MIAKRHLHDFRLISSTLHQEIGGVNQPLLAIIADHFSRFIISGTSPTTNRLLNNRALSGYQSER